MRSFALAICLGVLFSNFSASAAETDLSLSPTPEICKSVTIAGIEVVCLTEGVGAFSAAERAKAAHDRLTSLSEDRTFDASKIKPVLQSNTYGFLANDTLILTLSAKELGESDANLTEQKANLIAESMRAGIEADRLLKNPDKFLWGSLKTLAVSTALLALLLFFNWLAPKIYNFISLCDGRYIKTLKIQSFELLNSKRIIAFATWAAQTLRFFLTLLAFYIYIPLVLSFFPWTERWSPKLFGFVVTPFITFFGVVIDYVPNLFFIIVIWLITRYLLKVTRFIFLEVEQGNLKFDGFYKEWADPTYKLVRVIFIAFAFVMAFPYLPGSHSPAFQGVSVFLGILLSLGSSSAIGNTVAGIVLTYMRPFKIGDRVKIADTTGDVIEKTLLVTRIKSIKHVEITIPNSMVLGSHMINYSAAAYEQGLILNTTVTIGYDASWKQVHELLIAAAQKTKLIDTERKNFVLQTALNDFFVSYELNAYTKFPNEMAQIYSDLHQNIQDCFNDAGVEIMSPHYSSLRDGNDSAMNSDKKQNGRAFKIEVDNPRRV
jgi:small-conductance mechanosensitive channel